MCFLHIVEVTLCSGTILALTTHSDWLLFTSTYYPTAVSKYASIRMKTVFLANRGNRYIEVFVKNVLPEPSLFSQ